MKKILSIALIATLTVAFSAGCGGSSPEAESHSAKVSDRAIYVGMDDNEAIIEAIKKAADATGWNITEFKSNEVIAEKVFDDKTIASSIAIYDGYVDFENGAAAELADAIEEEVAKEKEDGSH